MKSIASEEPEIRRQTTAASQDPLVGEDLAHREAEELEAGRSDYVEATWVHKTAFTVLGIADLFFWNSILDVLYDIRDKVYPDHPSMTDTLTAVNVLSTLTVAIYTVKTGAMNLSLTATAGFFLVVACLGTALIVQLAPGLTGVILLHIACCVAGACSGLYQTGGCGLASVIGEGGLSGYVSTGQGITGVLTFALYQIIKQCKLSVKSSLWALLGIGAAVNVASAYNFFLMTRRPEIATRAAQVKQALATEASNPDAPSYCEICKHCWKPMFSTFWNFYISLFFFPNIGPINWGEGDFTSYTLGCFQVGDLIGRYTPVLIPSFCLSVQSTLMFSIVRTLLLPLGILTWHWPDSSFWGNKGWHMILIAILSISNGYVASCSWIQTPVTLPQKDWRSRAMNLAVLSTLTGISAGLWTARIFTALAI